MSSTQTARLPSLTREEFWRQHIQQWQASRQSKSAYCRECELNYHQFLYWCRRRAAGGSESGTDRPESGFVSVALGQPGALRANTSLSVELPGGVVVKDVTAATVPVVVQLLRSL